LYERSTSDLSLGDVPMPRLSIITVTRDRPQLLANAIASISQQTGSDFEWIVINDGSDPKTKEIVSHVTFPHTYLEMAHPPTGFGLSIGRNRGLMMAQGDVVTYLDDDNTFKPNFVAETIAFFDDNPSINYSMPIQQRQRHAIEDGEIVKRGGEFFSPTLDCSVADLIAHQQLIDSNGFTHRRTPNLRWNPDLKIYIDYEFFLQCASEWGANRFSMNPKVLVNYIQTNLGVIGSSNYQQWANELEQILQQQASYPCLDEEALEWLEQLVHKYQQVGSDRIAAFASNE
jgi:glycosyltransferase involved in cell wall biosynthesis